MIVKIKNKTPEIISLDNAGTILLQANEAKFCFYNKELLVDQNKIRALLVADIVQFLDENGNVVVKADANEPNGIIGIGLVSTMFNDLIFKNTTKEENIKLRSKICIEIKELIKSMFNNENVDNYEPIDLVTALDSKKVLGLLEMNFIPKAGNAINSITSDAFFTNARKTKLKSICDAVSL